MGVRFPILVLKSPHITVVYCGYTCSSKSSICSVASVSVIFLLVRDAKGGRYILTMFTLWLFGSAIFTNIPYSFPVVYSMRS